MKDQRPQRESDVRRYRAVMSKNTSASVVDTDMICAGTELDSAESASADLPLWATLVDGARVQLRRLRPGDYDALIELVQTLTDRERYLRFFTMHPSYLDEWARSLSTPNDDQYVLGAFEDDSLIATANYVVTSQPGYAEVSVVVAHLQHERGVGTALLQALGHAAHRKGIHHLVADVLAENHPLRKVVVDAEWPCTWHRDGSVFSVDIDLDTFGADLGTSGSPNK
jgi:RimJ/RimL family protein N-acetyltransferase